MAMLQVHRNRDSATFYHLSKEEEIEIFASPSANGAHMLLFVCQLQDTVHHDNTVQIMEMVSTCDEGTIVSARVRSDKKSDFLKRVRDMDIVDKMMERSNGYASFPSMLEKILHSKAEDIGSSKRICVTLKQPKLSVC